LLLNFLAIIYGLSCVILAFQLLHLANLAKVLIRSLKILLNWAKRRGYITRLPEFDQKALLCKYPVVKPIFSGEDIDLLLAAAKKEATPLLQLRARAVTLLLYDTGLRASELCQAKWKDISCHIIDGDEIHVLRVIGAKTGKPREVVLSKDIWKAILEYREELKQPHGRGYKVSGLDPSWLLVTTCNLIDSEPLSVRGLRTIFRRLEKDCDVHSNPHKFRRSFATAWLENFGRSGNRDINVNWRMGGF